MIGVATALSLGAILQVAASDVERDRVWLLDRPVLEITVARGLTAQQGLFARRMAATYVYVGMCRGSGMSNTLGAVQMITVADPTVPLEAAALEMLGIYTRVAFGRQDSWLCDRAFEDATRDW